MNQSHRDEVESVPTGARRLARGDHSEVQSLAVDEHVRGVQFHPEMNGRVIRTIVDARRRILRDDADARGRDVTAHPDAILERTGDTTVGPDDPLGPDAPARQRRMDWASLLRRTFLVDVFVCPRCSGAMRIIAFVDGEQVATRILQRLGVPTSAKPRGPPTRGRTSGSVVEDWPIDEIDPPCITA